MCIRKKLFLLSIFLPFLFVIYLYTISKAYSDFVFCNISDSFVRFHVIANSNSTEDQIIKYKIRDSVLEYISPLLQKAHSKQEALNIISREMSEINNIANKIVQDNGMNYSINIHLGKSKFPTKDYNNFILPEGIYDALKIEIGSANGQNWWCVMFPSICFPALNDTEVLPPQLRNSLGTEELSIISNTTDTPEFKFKFKLIEIFENI